MSDSYLWLSTLESFKAFWDLLKKIPHLVLRSGACIYILAFRFMCARISTPTRPGACGIPGILRLPQHRFDLYK